MLVKWFYVVSPTVGRNGASLPQTTRRQMAIMSAPDECWSLYLGKEAYRSTPVKNRGPHGPCECQAKHRSEREWELVLGARSAE